MIAIKERLTLWRQDKCKAALWVGWLATVFFSFWADALGAITVPAVGSVFPYRVFLPLTVALYIVHAVRRRENPWKDASAVEKWCYGFIVILLVCGAASLFRALDTGHTFRRLFNLTLDLCFFYLALRLCKDKTLRRWTLAVLALSLGIHLLLGVYESVHRGIFRDIYNGYRRFYWFDRRYQHPVVTFANTNDYLASMLFSGAALLLAAGVHWERVRRHRGLLVLLAAWFSVQYFVTLAGGGRLVLAAMYVLAATFLAFLLLADRKRLWLGVLVLVLLGGVTFANRYHTIMPQIQTFLSENFRAEDSPVSPDGKPDEEPSAPPAQTEDTPSLKDQFFEEDAETGEMVLRQTGSSGVRTRLLIHAGKCFIESFGLGVGLGNTEILARDREVIAGGATWSIHCFLARLVADFGLFALVPLCAIALLLLKRVWEALRLRNGRSLGVAVLFFGVLLMFPIASTASSDAQDLVAMWLYLAILTLFGANSLTAPSGEESGEDQSIPTLAESEV